MAERPRTAPTTISTSPEDAGGYRRGTGTRRGSGGGGGRMIGINLILAVLVAGVVLAGWVISNQHQMLIAEQNAVAAAGARLKRLEDRTVTTDAALTESGQDTQDKLGFWESEIRKVWDIADKRNKNKAHRVPQLRNVRR